MTTLFSDRPLWTYHLAGATRPYGYVVQYSDAARSGHDWDATATATRLDDDTIIAERVSFDEARAALEQHAQQHADPVDGAGDRGAGL